MKKRGKGINEPKQRRLKPKVEDVKIRCFDLGF
jgi:hypothetical protein